MLDSAVWLCHTASLAYPLVLTIPPHPPLLRRRFRNAVAARSLGVHEQHLRLIPTICRLMSPLVLIFGPLIGVPAGEGVCLVLQGQGG